MVLTLRTDFYFGLFSFLKPEAALIAVSLDTQKRKQRRIRTFETVQSLHKFLTGSFRTVLVTQSDPGPGVNGTPPAAGRC